MKRKYFVKAACLSLTFFVSCIYRVEACTGQDCLCDGVRDLLHHRLRHVQRLLHQARFRQQAHHLI